MIVINKPSIKVNKLNPLYYSILPYTLINALKPNNKLSISLIKHKNMTFIWNIYYQEQQVFINSFIERSDLNEE